MIFFTLGFSYWQLVTLSKFSYSWRATFWSKCNHKTVEEVVVAYWLFFLQKWESELNSVPEIIQLYTFVSALEWYAFSPGGLQRISTFDSNRECLLMAALVHTGWNEKHWAGKKQTELCLKETKVCRCESTLENHWTHPRNSWTSLAYILFLKQLMAHWTFRPDSCLWHSGYTSQLL